MDGFGATKSKGVGLSVHAISFQDFQPMWSWSTNVTDRQTTCDRNTALCTIVHHAVKTKNGFYFTTCTTTMATTSGFCSTGHFISGHTFLTLLQV